MDYLQIHNLYNLDETIAKEIFEGITYPWEVLAKINAFIVKLGNTLPDELYEKKEKIYGLPGRRKYILPHLSGDRQLLTKRRRSGTAPLSEAMPS